MRQRSRPSRDERKTTAPDRSGAVLAFMGVRGRSPCIAWLEPRPALTQPSRKDPSGQWFGVYRQGVGSMGVRTQGAAGLQPPRKAHGEWADRSVQRSVARRVPKRELVHEPGQRTGRSMERARALPPPLHEGGAPPRACYGSSAPPRISSSRAQARHSGVAPSSVRSRRSERDSS